MIKIDDLKFRYEGASTFALQGVSIEIPAHKHVAILGHNGSGKSTLSKLIVGLYKPTSGSITIDGIKLEKATLKEIRKKIGIVFQNPDNQFIGASVEDDIAFGLENKRLDRETMKQVIHKFAKQVGMLDFLNAEPQSLSGGQKQRVAIASTLALDPEIIIFDEVTSMLDPKGKTEVLNLISEIRKQRKKTIISITHDMDEAILADQVLVFADGKLIANGDPHQILADKRVVEIARIDAPFVYRVASQLVKNGRKIKLTFDQSELVREICK